MSFILPDLTDVAKIKIFYAASNFGTKKYPKFKQHKRFKLEKNQPSPQKNQAAATFFTSSDSFCRAASASFSESEISWL